MKVMKAETKLEAIQETQKAVAGVQGAFYQQLEAISNKVTLIEHGVTKLPVRALDLSFRAHQPLVTHSYSG
jgi:hypothetical protein